VNLDIGDSSVINHLPLLDLPAAADAAVAALVTRQLADYTNIAATGLPGGNRR
jgi:hypothetical protein